MSSWVCAKITTANGSKLNNKTASVLVLGAYVWVGWFAPRGRRRNRGSDARPRDADVFVSCLFSVGLPSSAGGGWFNSILGAKESKDHVMSRTCLCACASPTETNKRRLGWWRWDVHLDESLPEAGRRCGSQIHWHTTNDCEMTQIPAREGNCDDSWSISCPTRIKLK